MNLLCIDCNFASLEFDGLNRAFIQESKNLDIKFEIQGFKLLSSCRKYIWFCTLMGTHLLFPRFSTATFRPKWAFLGNYWVRWPLWSTWLAHCGAWHCPSYHLGSVAGTERPIGPAFSHRRVCLSPHLILLIFPDWAGVCCILSPQDFKGGFEGKNKKKLLYVTGCSLSDQHILSSINLKYNDWFFHIFQIYTNSSITSFANFELPNNFVNLAIFWVI